MLHDRDLSRGQPWIDRVQLCDLLFHRVTDNHANGTRTAGGCKQWSAVVGFEMAQLLKARRATAPVAAAPSGRVTGCLDRGWKGPIAKDVSGKLA